jgi:hypothetical protein
MACSVRRSGSGAVSLLELEVGLQTLGASVGAIVEGIPRVRAALAQAAAACDTPVAPTDCWRTEAAAGEARLLIGLDAFVSAYARAAAAISASAMSRQLDVSRSTGSSRPPDGQARRADEHCCACTYGTLARRWRLRRLTSTTTAA